VLTNRNFFIRKSLKFSQNKKIMKFIQISTFVSLVVIHALSSATAEPIQSSSQRLRSDRQLQFPTRCKGVNNETELLNAINLAVSGTTLSTRINLCSDIALSATPNDTSNGATKFDISGKDITLSCGKLTRCVLNAQGYGNRIFSGMRSKFTATRVDFVNAGSGMGITQGGALLFRRSTVTLKETSFLNNAASYQGGAIFAEDSTLTITGGPSTSPVIFSDNRSGNRGGAIAILQGRLIAKSGSIIFAQNSATSYGGAISMGSTPYETKLKSNVTAVSFTSNTASFVSIVKIVYPVMLARFFKKCHTNSLCNPFYYSY
jgi:predicted outer membrane repeat protein